MVGINIKINPYRAKSVRVYFYQSHVDDTHTVNNTRPIEIAKEIKFAILYFFSFEAFE